MTELQILEGAHALLSRQGGWTRGTDRELRSYGGHYSFCLRGAVKEVGGTKGFNKIKERLVETIFSVYPHRRTYHHAAEETSPWFYDSVITSFNDGNKRRKYEVLHVLEVMIADERARLAEKQEGEPLAPIVEEIPEPVLR
jgi:hypothetical protein